MNESCCIMSQIYLEFVPNGLIDIKSALVQVMAWHQTIIWTSDDVVYRRIYALLDLNEWRFENITSKMVCYRYTVCCDSIPDSKIRGANIGPIWQIQMGSMLAPWTLLSGICFSVLQRILFYIHNKKLNDWETHCCINSLFWCSVKRLYLSVWHKLLTVDKRNIFCRLAFSNNENDKNFDINVFLYVSVIIGYTVEIWEWINNFTPHVILDVSTYPSWY